MWLPLTGLGGRGGDYTRGPARSTAGPDDGTQQATVRPCGRLDTVQPREQAATSARADAGRVAGVTADLFCGLLQAGGGAGTALPWAFSVPCWWSGGLRLVSGHPYGCLRPAAASTLVLGAAVVVGEGGLRCGRSGAPRGQIGAGAGRDKGRAGAAGTAAGGRCCGHRPAQTARSTDGAIGTVRQGTGRPWEFFPFDLRPRLCDCLPAAETTLPAAV